MTNNFSFVFLGVALVCLFTAASAADDVCSGVSCGHGRTCVASGSTPTCQCARSCPPHAHPVCGTDSAWYPNHCELHRHACMLGKAISIDHTEKSCKATPEKAATKRFREKPVVCYQEELNYLREKLMAWVASRQEDGSTPQPRDDVVEDTFKHCDVDSDAMVNSLEFLKCAEEDSDIRSTPSPDLPEDEITADDQQKVIILRGLCIDALIDATDSNSDWGLDLTEFSNALDPNFLLPRKRCALEERQFEDGAETKVDCNSCICACGNWVCTSKICDKNVLPPATSPPSQSKHGHRHDKHHSKHRNLH